MTNHNPSEQSRSRMANAVVGKAKEFAGAVTGNDELTEEGRLRQEQADAQREATSREARADAREAEAERDRDAAVERGLEQKHAAEQEAARDKVRITEEELR